MYSFEQYPVVLQTKRVSRKFRDCIAVDAIDLEIRRGEIFGLLGPNGAGKTTLLRMMLGILTPTSGQIELFRLDISHASLRQTALRRVGALIEYPTFYPYLNGRENLLVLASVSGQRWSSTLRARIDEVLSLVELARQTLPFHRYSLGMKQRLGIAAALLTYPELVILDEPTNGLDPIGIARLRSLLNELTQQGTTILFSSHLLHEVQQLCTRVAFLNKGHVVTQGPVTDLLQQQSTVQIVFDTQEDLQKAERLLRDNGSQDQPEEWLQGTTVKSSSLTDGEHMLLIDIPVRYSARLWGLLAHHNLYPAEIKRQQRDLEQLFLQVSSEKHSPDRADHQLIEEPA